MKKTITLYHCDVAERKMNLQELIEHIAKEFSGVPFGEIKPTLGISITFEAEPREKARKVRMYKSQM